ncbi:MAG: hypothetical protein ACD_58C00002G0005 [uncultured bacterium]|nr:MAG: hypothetical protein ACD_58C00002G0005 [uncultured bacterium]
MIYFIALIVFLLPSYLVRFSVFGIPTTMLEVLIYGAFVTTLILKLKSKNEKPKLKTKNLYIIPIILFIISGILSVAMAPDKREALGLFKAYIIDPILFFYIVISFDRKKEILNPKHEILNKPQFSNNQSQNKSKIINHKSEILMKALIASGVLVALHAIWQKLTGDTTIDGRILGIFSLDANSSPNYLAFYLVPIAVLISGLEMNIIGSNLMKIDSFYKNIWYYDISFILITYAIWLTGSRAAIGALVAGVISYFVISYWQKIKSNRIFTLLLYCFITLLLVIGWQNTKPDWGATPDAGRISSSNNIRWEIWNTTVKDMIPHNMVWLKGVGFGNYQNYFSELTNNKVNYPEWITPWAHTPHNLFLNIWMNLGLLGLISFIWILTLFFKPQTTNTKSQINPNIQIKNLPADRQDSNQSIIHHSPFTIYYSMMIAILIQGLVDSSVYKNDLWILFWLIIGLSIIINLSTSTKD